MSDSSSYSELFKGKFIDAKYIILKLIDYGGKQFLKLIKVGIIGTSSLTSGEIIKILLKHPRAKLAYLESENFAGKKVWEVHKFLKGVLDLNLKNFSEEEITENCSVTFISKQHNYASGISRNLIAKGVRVIDLSADFRLKDAEVYRKWYGIEHKDHALLKKAVYGLSELYS